MPRQTQDSAKRRRSPATESPMPQHDAVAEKPSRKRMREVDLPSSRAPKRQRSPLTSSTRRDDNASAPSPPRSPVRSPPRKRPGASSRVTAEAKMAAEKRRREREEEERRAVQETRAPDPADIVSAHYNAVPQRDRGWRKTGSSIKGLRSLNNWIKSTVIQRFSQPEMPTRDLLVLDMGCGKGGDLQKWQSAPQAPKLYVGIDPANVSIDQARDRYQDMSRRNRRGPGGRPLPLFDAHFIAQDAFGESLVHIPIVREVGFDPNAGPNLNGTITGRFSSGGFDCVTMMFCLHYSYENEEKARGMLKNVAGALKKGGHFLGVMPNSDVIRKRIEDHFRGVKPAVSKSTSPGLNYDDDEEDTWDPTNGADDDDDWNPEKSLEQPQTANAESEDEWDPEKSMEPGATKAVEENGKLDSEVKTPANTKTPVTLEEDLQWGNSKYTVKFQKDQPLPSDGVFRPPFGWKYLFQLEEAVDVPEFVVPWEGFRALAEEYGLELMYRKPFPEVWEENKDDPILGPLSERMGVRNRDGTVNFSSEEMEAAAFYHAFCFYKI